MHTDSGFKCIFQLIGNDLFQYLLLGKLLLRDLTGWGSFYYRVKVILDIAHPARSLAGLFTGWGWKSRG